MLQCVFPPAFFREVHKCLIFIDVQQLSAKDPRDIVSWGSFVYGGAASTTVG